jgi:1-hydroxycarotenoid 3,4-desaturase
LGLILGAGVKGLPDLLATSPFESMWKALGRHFQEPRLRQLFGRYATYCGSSPFLSPATLMLIAHVEQDGVWMVDGGMHALAQAFASAAQSKGAQIHYDAHVQKIMRSGTGFVVETAKGQVFQADKIIFNGDANALAQGFLGNDLRNAAPAVAPNKRSLSAVTCTMTARTKSFPLVRHNVFFSHDYPAEFAALQSGSLDYDPTVYVCAQDRGDDDEPKDTPERLLMLVNAPAFGDQKSLSDAEIEQCMMRMMARVEACGLQIDKEPERRHITTPQDFNQLFPATGGAIYGRPTHGWRATFTRPGVRSPIPNLYLTGGSVHPGAGIPMAALSGLTAAACLMQDQTSR